MIFFSCLQPKFFFSVCFFMKTLYLSKKAQKGSCQMFGLMTKVCDFATRDRIPVPCFESQCIFSLQCFGFVFHSLGVCCLCLDANFQGLVDICDQLCTFGWSWRQKPGQILSLCAGLHSRIHWKKQKKTQIQPYSKFTISFCNRNAPILLSKQI